MAVEFFRQQYTTVPPLEPRDLAGQIVVITGASQGLGFEMAKYVAGMNPAKLIVTGRNADKMASALDDITAATGCKTITAWALDLNSHASVKAFVDRIQELDRLDILICNAGLQNGSFKVKEGHEETLQANVYGTFLLLFSLLPLLKKTTSTHRNGGPARAIVVASDVHSWVPTLPDTPTLLADLNSRERTDAAANASDLATKQLAMGIRYPVSKLLEILIVRELIKQLDPKDVVIATANPGLCHSSLGRDFSGVFGFLFWAMKQLLARPTDAGARALLYPALGPPASAINGKYFSSSRDYPVSPYVESAAASKAGKLVFDELLTELEKVDKRVKAGLSK